MIHVFGSINVDNVLEVAYFPKPGETISAHRMLISPGGKGANQALAVARSGQAVSLIAAVGDQGNSDTCLTNLKADSSVDLSRVATVQGPSGTAFVTVSESSENTIVLAAGANMYNCADATRLDGVKQGDFVIFQNELDPTQTENGIRIAKAKGATTIWNLAPVGQLQSPPWNCIDLLIVNRSEAKEVSQQLGISIENDDYAGELSDKLGLDVIVTIGSEGAVVGIKSEQTYISAPKVKPVDTTGAGDTFVGYLVGQLATGRSYVDAGKHACHAAALSTTHHGAQAGIPSKEKVREFIN